MRTVGEVVGRNVGLLRKAAGLTQEELAQAMSSLGFSWHRQTVLEAESGRRPISIEELVALAAFFDMAPNALVMAPGGDLEHRQIAVGKQTVTNKDWINLWRMRFAANPPPPDARSAIDKLVGALTRPWSKLWRARGGHAALAFRDAREQKLARRSRYPGPIYLDIDADGPVEHACGLPPWSTEFRIKLSPGEPYVARDEIEAERLADLEGQGFIRRIDKQTAWQIRKTRAATSKTTEKGRRGKT